MMIDKILDRKDGQAYNPKQFYDEAVQYGEVATGIASALDSGEESDVKRALCDYIIKNDYNRALCGYINSVEWLND